MESLPSEAARTTERLHTLSANIGAFGELLAGARPVAGIASLPTLASWYATAQGFSSTALVLLLNTAEQPYAHTTASGHHAVESLGQLVKTSSDITAHVADAVAVAAEYHRADGLRDPVTGRMSARPGIHRWALDEHLDSAAALIKPARAACHNAAAFTETAGLRAEARAAEPVPLPDTTLAEQRALRLLADEPVLLSADRRGDRRTWTGSGEQVSTATVDSLTGKELVRLDAGGSLTAGQRLLVTDLGRRVLDAPGHEALQHRGPVLGPALPVPPSCPGPARAR